MMMYKALSLLAFVGIASAARHPPFGRLGRRLGWNWGQTCDQTLGKTFCDLFRGAQLSHRETVTGYFTFSDADLVELDELFSKYGMTEQQLNAVASPRRRLEVVTAMAAASAVSAFVVTYKNEIKTVGIEGYNKIMELITHRRKMEVQSAADATKIHLECINLAKMFSNPRVIGQMLDDCIKGKKSSHNSEGERSEDYSANGFSSNPYHISNMW
jgi:hypothetical protein